ncbi:MAG: hypothetical protein ACXWXJ_05545, partial [Aeromicrobium sp.]
MSRDFPSEKIVGLISRTIDSRPDDLNRAHCSSLAQPVVHVLGGDSSSGDGAARGPVGHRLGHPAPV